jgi:hypothetical protein
MRARPHHIDAQAAGSSSRLSPGNASPSRGSACCAVLVRSEMSSGPSPVSCARKSRWPSYRGIEADVPSLHPAYKGRTPAVPAQAAEQPVRPVPRRCQVLASRGCGAEEPPKRLPHVSPNLPVPLVCQPRRPSRRSRSSSCGYRRPPPQSAAESIAAPSPATNRPFPPLPWPNPPPEPPNFCRSRRPMPRDYIASPLFFPGCFS